MHFPHELGAPAVSNFVESQQGTHQRIQFDAGFRVRRKVRRRASGFTVVYLLSHSDKVLLEQFYRQAKGEVFTMALPGPDDLFVPYYVKFLGPLKVVHSGTHYQCSFQLRTVSNPIIPRSEIEQAMVDLIISRKDFHLPLHNVIHGPNF